MRILLSLTMLTMVAFASHHHDYHHASEVVENSTAIVNNVSKGDPDISRSFKDIVTENGFRFEEHKITTQDGYILKVFRIPGKTATADAPLEGTNKKVVFMQHGILDSADCWIAHYASVAPAFVLARAGYDVWLGNSRGNKYSHDHTNAKISKKAYWDFSFEKMGEKDLPAAIDYVLKNTGQAKLAYVGHSQGTS